MMKNAASKMRILERTTEELECALTETERLDRGDSLAHTQGNIEREKGDQKQKVAAMKAELARLESELARFALIVSRKAEPRDVAVEVFADDATGFAITVRKDTGEIVRRRPLAFDERQPSLPLEEGKASGEKTDKAITVPKDPNHPLALVTSNAKADQDGVPREGESATEYAERRSRELRSNLSVQVDGEWKPATVKNIASAIGPSLAAEQKRVAARRTRNAGKPSAAKKRR